MVWGIGAGCCLHSDAASTIEEGTCRCGQKCAPSVLQSLRIPYKEVMNTTINCWVTKMYALPGSHRYLLKRSRSTIWNARAVKFNYACAGTTCVMINIFLRNGLSARDGEIWVHWFVDINFRVWWIKNGRWTIRHSINEHLCKKRRSSSYVKGGWL